MDTEQQKQHLSTQEWASRCHLSEWPGGERGRGPVPGRLSHVFGVPGPGVRVRGGALTQPLSAGQDRGGEAAPAAAEREHETEDGGAYAEKAASCESLALARGVEGSGVPGLRLRVVTRFPPLKFPPVILNT